MADRPRLAPLCSVSMPAVFVLAHASTRAFSASLRGNLLRMFGSGVGVLSEGIGVIFLVDRFGGIASWSTAEVLLLYGIGGAGLRFGMLFGDPLEPPAFSQLLRDGRFDQALTRPMSPLLFVVADDVQIRNLGGALAGLGVTVYAAGDAGLEPSPTVIATIALAVLGMAVLVGSLLTIGAALTMWTVEGTEVLNSFTYGGASLAGWPLQIYASALRAVFLWIVPIGAVVYIPALWLLGREGVGVASPDLAPFVPLLVLAFTALAGLAWRAGLRHHTGAGG